MNDIQVTLDTFKKFTANVFMIDNIPDISVFGDTKDGGMGTESGECKFQVKLSQPLNLKNNLLGWDVYLTSVFIGGYKMEQYAHPGCLFENRFRWVGDKVPTNVNGAGDVYPTNHGIPLNDTGWDGNTFSNSGDLVVSRTNANTKNNATQSIFFNNLKGGYEGIDQSGSYVQPTFTGHTPTNGHKQTTFKNESVQAFFISIDDGTDNYTPGDGFIGAYPLDYKVWKGNDGLDVTKTFGWSSKDSVIDEDAASPNKITGGLILMNNQKQRNDGFLSGGASTNQPEDRVVDGETGGSLTVQDYVPFIYDERENNPIYLKTITDLHEVNHINIKITDQNGYSIWGPAHVSQMKNEFGIDANPPTNSRRIIIKLTYKPKIKNKLEEAITALNNNIETLIDKFENPNYKTSSLNGS